MTTTQEHLTNYFSNFNVGRKKRIPQLADAPLKELYKNGHENLNQETYTALKNLWNIREAHGDSLYRTSLYHSLTLANMLKNLFFNPGLLLHTHGANLLGSPYTAFLLEHDKENYAKFIAYHKDTIIQYISDGPLQELIDQQLDQNSLECVEMLTDFLNHLQPDTRDNLANICRVLTNYNYQQLITPDELIEMLGGQELLSSELSTLLPRISTQLKNTQDGQHVSSGIGTIITEFSVQKIMQLISIPENSFHPSFTKNDLEKVLLATIPSIATTPDFPINTLLELQESLPDNPNNLVPEDFRQITSTLLSLPSTTVTAALISLGAKTNEAADITTNLQSDKLKQHLPAIIESSVSARGINAHASVPEDEATIMEKQQNFLTHASTKTLRFMLYRFSPLLAFILNEKDLELLKDKSSRLPKLLQAYTQKRYSYVIYSLFTLSAKILANKLKRQILLSISIGIALMIIVPVTLNLMGMNIPWIASIITAINPWMLIMNNALLIFIGLLFLGLTVLSSHTLAFAAITCLLTYGFFQLFQLFFDDTLDVLFNKSKPQQATGFDPTQNHAPETEDQFLVSTLLDECIPHLDLPDPDDLSDPDERTALAIGSQTAEPTENRPSR